MYTRVLAKLGLEFSFVDTRDPERIRDAMRPNTRLVHVETPTNPMMRICDIRAAADIAHEGDALLMVDSTFASPVNQRPLALGADVSMHSSTKYLNGHSDIIGGVLVVNVVGSFIAGVALSLPLDPTVQLIIVSGVCGGLTTFSTFAVETIQLVSEGKHRTAAASVALNIALAVPAALALLPFALIHPIFALPALAWAVLCLGFGSLVGLRAGGGFALLAGVAAMTMQLSWAVGFLIEWIGNPRSAAPRYGLADTAAL